MNAKQRAFFAAFRETGNVCLACVAAKVARSSHYRWLDESAVYREAFESAREDAADTLEAEAYRRAVERVEKLTGWYKGVAGGSVLEYSDNLLMFLLKGIRPDKFKDRVEFKGALASIDLNKLPDELIARIADGEHPLSVLASASEEVKRLALPSPSE